MKRVVWVIASLFILALVFVFPVSAYADVNNFAVTDFAADYYLTDQDPQGSLHVIEKIKVHFTDNNHGILRALPTTYKNHSLQLHVNRVSSPTGAPAGYTVYQQNNNEVLKIGDPNRTVTGDQEYYLDYTYTNVITFYNDHDELYWDVNGDQWSQPFTHVTATLHLPNGLAYSSQGAACYAGTYGSTKPCAVSTVGGVTTFGVDNLGPGETLTFVAGFQKGYFAPAGWVDFLRDNAPFIAQLVVPIVVIGGAGFLWWWKRGRDAKGTGVIVPQFDAPDGLTPLEVGTLADFRVDNRDLTATVIDLAIRKYFRIIEVDAPKLLVLKHKGYRFELLNKDWSKLNTPEWVLMGGLFGAAGERESVDLAAMSTKLQAKAKSIKSLVEKSLADRGYFTVDPSGYLKVTVLTAGAVALAVLWHASMRWQGPVLWGALVGGIVFGVFYHFLPARTAKGTAAKEHVLGLKMYLEVAEKDRIKMLQSPDAPYAERSAAPEQTIELFEKLLPYAIVLKVEEQWAKKFEDLYKAPPDWYAGNTRAFTTGYLVGSLGGSFNQAMVSSFNPPRSSGTSGFGGGGFAGGGGGGGGGGGW